MIATASKVDVQYRQNKEVTVKRYSIFLGLIKWEEIVKENIIGNDLLIWTNGKEINDIYLDGIKIK